MAETVGQHSVAAFTSPVNGTTPIDANSVRGNDNTVRSAYVDHDADPGIHVQSSTLASRPVAGTAGRKWVTVSSGRYQFWYDDGSRWHEVASDAINVDCLADANLAKGDVVKVTGFNNGQNLPTVNKVTSSTDVAFGVVENTVTSGNIVQIVNTGLIEDLNTGAFAINDILYPNTSGGLTLTKPTSGNYQPVAFVLRSNNTNGVLYVEFSAPRIVERSNNEASTIVLRDASGNFAAGTITAGALTASGAVSAGSVTSTGLVTFASLKGTGATTVTNILDEDNMASDSATALATQQSIKAYVDAKVATVDTLAEVLANGNTTGATDIIVTAGQKITTDTIAETSSGFGVTIDSVLLKDDVVNATDIEVDTISANNGTLAVTLASTGVATIAQQPILSSLTASQAVFTDASKGLVSNAITGTGNVVMSASPTLTGTVTAATINATTLGGTLSTAAQPNVTSLGTLSSLAVTGNLTLGADVVLSRGAADRLDLASGDALNVVSGTYKIANTDVLSATTLGSGVTASSLTSVGTLSSLTVSGDLTVDTSTLKVDSANNRVGIGTASPAVRLDVVDTAAVARLRSSSSTAADAPRLRFFHEGNDEFHIAGGDGLLFYGGGTNLRMTLTGSGNLGLGVTPSAPLHVKAASNEIMRLQSSDATTGSLYFSFYDSADAEKAYIGYGSSSNDDFLFVQRENAAMAFYTNATERARITSGGDVQIRTADAYLYSNGTSGGTTIDAGFRFLSSSKVLSFWTNDTEKARITSDGYLCAGRTTTVNGARFMSSGASVAYGTEWAANTYLSQMYFDSSYYMGVLADSGGRELRMVANSGDSTAKITFYTGGAGTPTERARITSGGYFKASNDGTYQGSTGAYHEFRTTQNDQVSLFVTSTAASGNQYGIQVRTANDQNNGTNNFLTCYGASTERATINSNGGLSNYSANNVNLASDFRLKQDIAPLASTWDKLKAIEVVNFRYKDCNEDDPALYGVIAQQVQPIVPELVVVTREAVEAKDAELDEDGNEVKPAVEAAPEYYGIREQPMYWLAIKALQEAQARIEALEARLEALEA